jgi:hypothetical protein
MFLALAGMAPAQPPVLGIVETGVESHGVDQDPGKGYEYVLVAISVTNIAGEEHGISAGDFRFFERFSGQPDAVTRMFARCITTTRPRT